MKTTQLMISKEKIQEILEFLKSLRLPASKNPLKALILQIIVKILLQLIRRELTSPKQEANPTEQEAQ